RVDRRLLVVPLVAAAQHDDGADADADEQQQGEAAEAEADEQPGVAAAALGGPLVFLVVFVVPAPAAGSPGPAAGLPVGPVLLAAPAGRASAGRFADAVVIILIVIAAAATGRAIRDGEHLLAARAARLLAGCRRCHLDAPVTTGAGNRGHGADLEGGG